MKIIATTPGGFILQADEQEVYRLVGHYYRGNASREIQDNMKVGTEIKVSEMFDQLYKVREITSKTKQISKLAEELIEAVATRNPVIQPIVDAIITATPK